VAQDKTPKRGRTYYTDCRRASVVMVASAVSMQTALTHTLKRNQAKGERTDWAWFSHLLWHLTRKQSGSILSTWSVQDTWVPEFTRAITTKNLVRCW